MKLTLTISAVVFFIHACTWPGMVFSFVRYSLDGLPAILRKPLYDCPTCMTVWWGPTIIATGVYLQVFPVETNPFVWLFSIVTAAGINAMVTAMSGDKSPCDCGKKKFKSISDG